MTTAESHRLAEVRSGAADWRRWGTYLSERAWGTVREDYSAEGDAWNYFPFEHSHRRAYRWNEDGLAGWCDRDQIMCFGVALWNGNDAIVKERPFGLSNEQGNHGEDAKDYWFYTDNTPTHAYASMVYKYPHAAFPYDDLRRTNAARGQDVGEYELFEALADDWRANRYFDVNVEYAKASPEEFVWRITVTNRGEESAPIHVLPQAWYRNTWSWDEGAQAPSFALSGTAVTTTHPQLGDRWLSFEVSSPAGSTPNSVSAASTLEFIFCDNETNSEALFGSPNSSPHPTDGINDYVVHSRADAVSRTTGSKVAAHVSTTLGSGESVVITGRFSPADLARPFDDADDVLTVRKAESTAFYETLAAQHLTDDERLVQRQALAGLLWCKQYYHYEVRRWLRGDSTQPTPPAERWTGRNSDWQHLINRDVILMPDAWEYPWYAAWDLAFHCVTVALIDPDLAKEQVLLLLSSITQHPHGQIPAYEWNFGDTNPPVHAWAAWQVFQLDRQARGVGDLDFLAAAYRSITLDVMWWLNQKDEADRGVFGGGFLGMDNIGVFDRDEPLPTGGSLAEVDGTAWMAALVMQMLEMTVELYEIDPSYQRMVGRWLWDSWLIANALEKGAGDVSLWNSDTKFYHDVIEFGDGRATSLEAFSLQSLVPLFASIAIPVSEHGPLAEVQQQMQDLRDLYEEPPGAVKLKLEGGDGSHVMYAVVNEERLRDILLRVLDPDQFLSDHGVRSVSARHREHPYVYHAGGSDFSVDYEPAESRSRMFGGNSNWRGPVWFPINLLLVQSLDSYARFLGDTFTVPCSHNSAMTLGEVADDVSSRLCAIFVRDASGNRAVFGDNSYFNSDEHWRDLVPFYEYFDGDTGRGLGASHQTGWTATVALLLQYGGSLRFYDRHDPKA